MSSSPLPRARCKVLIVDEDGASAEDMRTALEAACACELAATADAGLDAFSRESFDVVVSGDGPVGTSGLAFLDRVRERSPHVPFIYVTARGDVAGAVEAGRRGAFDYLVKPFDSSALLGSVGRAMDDRTARTSIIVEGSVLRPPSEPTIIGSSIVIGDTLDSIDRVAQSSCPVLLVGETGTGKDLLAARMHARGPRRHKPFVVVNAASMASTMLESELFGHVGGAFPGAPRARRGLVAEADGGTLFVDELADLPLDLQGRLLRVIESGAVRALGADHERSVDVRFVAATHRNLTMAVRDRTLREDLYFRMNVLSIRVPPLRERRGDIPALVNFFFQRARARNPRSPVSELSTPLLARIVAGSWPGNVRELATFIERLVVLGKHVSAEVSEADHLDCHVAPSSVDDVPVELCTLREMSTRHVETVLARTNGDKPRAATILGVDVSTLYRWQRRKPDEA